jgi:predicted TIM-barrel enzyme
LPWSPGYDGEPMEDIIGFALAEAARYRDGGVDGLIVENHGDIFTIASAVIVASWLKTDGVWWNPVDPDRVRTFMHAANRARI